MITITLENAGHFFDLYVDGKEKAKLTGDRVKMLMLTLPFMVCDLIAEQLEFNQLFELTTFNLQREQ